MDRRKFTHLSALASGSLLTVRPGKFHVEDKEAFPLKYAPHPGMFRHHAGEDFIDQLDFIADQGFTAVEDNDMRTYPVARQEALAQRMQQLGIEMGVFVAHKIYWNAPNLASGDFALRDAFLTDIASSVETAKRVNAKWMTVVPGHVDLRLDMAYQTAHVLESLRRASALLEPHGFTMVLEPLNHRDHPGMFLTGSAQAYALCKSVDSPACKILFDVYHQQITEGNLIPNIEACWDEIAYFQVGDNPGRKEPTTGEVNYRNVFKTLYEKGYQGIVGMEHGNAREGKEGETAVINAYRTCSEF